MEEESEKDLGKETEKNQKTEKNAMESCFLEWNVYGTHELIASVVTYLRPPQNQSIQNSSTTEKYHPGSNP